ncbi:MAG TPA: hypothetical protein VM553_03465 [Dongiaceae bacterium]|nr:hypothetical protein [Dongiaceae bacterium]
MKRLWVWVAALAVLLWGCSGENAEVKLNYGRLADVPAAKLEALGQQSFYFGHQSVGRDIMDGLGRLLAEHPEVKLNIVEGERPDQVQPGVFLHSRIGQNEHPQTKIDAFEQVLASGIGGTANVAFLKFCYVDLDQSGNPQDLFNRYQASVTALKAKYPATRFVHFTLPVRTVPTGWKVQIKNLIGREVPEQLDNLKRQQFNDLLRQTYGGKEPVFDLARLESIAADTGKSHSFKLEGQTVEAMAPVNTNDGGHLGDAGKRWIAEQLVVFLATLG